jgi:LacI family transcriptional regulator
MKETSERAPTIRDVARLAHVGLMTVSRVINNHPSLRPNTIKRVNAAIAALGYRKNEAARLLKGQRAMMIGLIVPDLSDAFFGACAHTVQQVARMHGYMTMVAGSDRDSELEIQQAELMASRKLSGLLVVTSVKDGDDRLQKLQETGLAIVAFDRPLSGAQTDAVVVENRLGSEEAVRHLIKHGHKRIVCIGYDEDVYTVRERMEGYNGSMRAAGLKPALALGLDTLDETRKWVQLTIKSTERPTAIFTLNNRMSAYVLQALSESGVPIPQGMALIGFDDFDLATVVSPPMTTVSQSAAEVARRAMALLLDRIAAHGRGTEFVPAKIVLPVTLTIRESCGCKPGAAI